MIVGRALETTVEDRNATNIASNMPDSAERISRWVIWPCCSTGATSGGATSSRRSADVWRVLLMVLLRGSSGVAYCGSAGGGDGGTGRRRVDTGCLEVGHQAVE